MGPPACVGEQVLLDVETVHAEQVVVAELVVVEHLDVQDPILVLLELELSENLSEDTPVQEERASIQTIF